MTIYFRCKTFSAMVNTGHDPLGLFLCFLSLSSRRNSIMFLENTLVNYSVSVRLLINIIQSRPSEKINHSNLCFFLLLFRFSLDLVFDLCRWVGGWVGRAARSFSCSLEQKLLRLFLLYLTSDNRRVEVAEPSS